jgi:hypothetical protein
MAVRGSSQVLSILHAAKTAMSRCTRAISEAQKEGLLRQVDMHACMNSISSKHDDDIAFIPDVWTNASTKKRSIGHDESKLGAS